MNAFCLNFHPHLSWKLSPSFLSFVLCGESLIVLCISSLLSFYYTWIYTEIPESRTFVFAFTRATISILPASASVNCLLTAGSISMERRISQIQISDQMLNAMAVDLNCLATIHFVYFSSKHQIGNSHYRNTCCSHKACPLHSADHNQQEDFILGSTYLIIFRSLELIWLPTKCQINMFNTTHTRSAGRNLTSMWIISMVVRTSQHRDNKLWLQAPYLWGSYFQSTACLTGSQAEHALPTWWLSGKHCSGSFQALVAPRPHFICKFSCL